jgi:hypothetical protein
MKSPKDSKKDQTNNGTPTILVETESFIFIKGAICIKCNNKFPMALTLQDNKITCPECETEASAF